MQKLKTIIIACSLMFMAGCIPSIHELYTEDTLAFNKQLLGKWVEDDSSTWEFEKASVKFKGSFFKFYNDDTYFLTYTENGSSATFQVHLVKLGNIYYLDFYPHEYEIDNELMQLHLFRAHTFAKVEIREDEVKIHMLDQDRIGDLFEENRIRIAHEETRDGIILTAKPESLQKFMIKYGEDDEAYIEPSVLSRITL